MTTDKLTKEETKISIEGEDYYNYHFNGVFVGDDWYIIDYASTRELNKLIADFVRTKAKKRVMKR